MLVPHGAPFLSDSVENVVRQHERFCLIAWKAPFVSMESDQNDKEF